jgi:hypothetical protein
MGYVSKLIFFDFIAAGLWKKSREGNAGGHWIDTEYEV